MNSLLKMLVARYLPKIEKEDEDHSSSTMNLEGLADDAIH